MLTHFLINDFEKVSAISSEENLQLYFEEKVTATKKFDIPEFVFTVFLDEINIQDFTLKGKVVYFCIKGSR